jgi:hypothetical protein
MEEDAIRSAILETVEASLAAQLRAVRSLRAGKADPGGRPAASGEHARKNGRSHVDMAHAILATAKRPLHVNDIIDQIAARFEVQVDRESRVSALTKRVMRQDRFIRTDKNTFAPIAGPASQPSDTHG